MPEQSEIRTEDFSVTCEDGVELHGVLLQPPAPRAVVQLNCATAAKKEFYLPFLHYLAENGFLCCLWDYRGSGDSAPPSLRGCDYSFRDYGLKDMPVIKAFLRRRFPELPIIMFGHSVGGQLVGMIDDLEGVKGLVGYAVSTGYAPYMPLGYRLQSHFFFYMYTPVSILLTGYLAAKRFGIMEDLPKNVVREWRAWCGRKQYFFDPKFMERSVPRGHYDDMPFPVHIFWSADDPISNARSVPAFWGNVKSSHPITFTQIDPKAMKTGTIGHFGFFKKRMREQLWPMALEKINAFL